MAVTILEGTDEPAAPPAPAGISTPPSVGASSQTGSAGSANSQADTSFTRKTITCQFTMASGGSSITTSGLRTVARIVKAGGLSMGSASVSIYGLPLSTINKLVTSGLIFTSTYKNSITISAGDEGKPLSLVFQGTIQVASFDGAAMPDACLRIEAYAGAIESVMPAQTTTIDGSGDVAQMMGSLAKTMGLTFENNSVNVKLSNPHYSGSPRTQVQEIAEHAGIQWIIDNGTLAIWPTGQARSGSSVLISPQTGMVAYPSFNQQGIVVRTLFNPSLKYGCSIQVQSDLQPACGTWNVYALEYELDAYVKRGKWFCVVSATAPGQMVVA